MRLDKMHTVSTMRKQLATISARIPKSQAEELNRLAAKKGIDRSAVVRELLASGLQEQRTKDALELLRLRKISVWKAAEISGLTYREVLDLIRAANIPFPLSSDEMRREIKVLASE